MDVTLPFRRSRTGVSPRLRALFGDTQPASLIPTPVRWIFEAAAGTRSTGSWLACPLTSLRGEHPLRGGLCSLSKRSGTSVLSDGFPPTRVVKPFLCRKKRPHFRIPIYP